MRLVRLVLPACMVLFLAACGATSAVKLSPKLAVQAPEAIGFQFVDDRAAETRISRAVDNNGGFNNYFGDDNLSPDAPALMKAWLHNNLAAELQGRKVTLSEFVVNVYAPPVTLNQAGLAAAGGGIFTALLIKGIESSRSEKVVHISIQGMVDTEPFFIIGSERFQGRVSDDNVQTTLVATLDKVVTDVRRAAAVK